jgi:hypothetical protein
MFIELTEMLKKSYDAYYIMTKMLGFSQLETVPIMKLQQYINRSRLSSKELIEDFKSQEEMLNDEVCHQLTIDFYSFKKRKATLRVCF